MPVSTPKKLASLRTELAKKPDHEILRQYLLQNDNELMKAAVLVMVYRTWSSSHPHTLKAIGITTFDRTSLNLGFPLPPGPHAEDLLENVWCLNLQIRSEQAPVNASSDEDSVFDFGTKSYTTQTEAEEALTQICLQPVDEDKAGEGVRPIILLTYGNNESLAQTRKTSFSFLPSNLPNTIATLDVQVIATQARITSNVDTTLEHLLSVFKIDSSGTDNAGNFAMYSTVVAFLSALRRELYEDEANRKVRVGQFGLSRDKPANQVVQSLIDRKTPAPPFGTTTFCWTCGNTEHHTSECEL